MNNERREIEYVTKISGYGYGLPWVVWGFIGLFPPMWGFVVSPLLASFNIPNDTIDAACLWSLALVIALAIYLTVFSLKFYRRTYGRVRIEKRERLRNELRYCLYMIPVVIAFTAGFWADKNIHPPTSISFLCLAVFSFVLWFAKGRGISNHQLWLGIMILLLSWFPLLGFAQREEVYGFSPLDYATLLSGILGLILAVEGFFDHLILARTLKSLPQEEDKEYEFV
jgi:uncharacterized membrane protein YbjE (DUF340 family)